MNNKLSVVMPVYNEGISIYKNVSRVKKILEEAGIIHEIVLIDDGSIDESWNEIVRATDNISNVKGVKLSRNFGKESALCAGIDAITGNMCVCIDSDMQHPPECIPKMYELSVKGGYEVVDGVKED